jgi:hypothetical protein
MIKQLCDIRDAVLRLRLQLRYGMLSRAPLRLLRFEWSGDHVDCDWIARPNDKFDEGLPEHVAEHNASQQALEDALVVRQLLFSALRDISSANFRVYRENADASLELIITGTVTRSERLIYRVHSLVMRAKLCGFQFDMDRGKLMPFQMKAG